MRQEINNIYTIDEHPDNQACYDWIRSNWHDLGDYIIEEMIESLKNLHNEIGGSLDFSLSITPDRGEFVKFTGYDKDTLKKLYNKLLTGHVYDQTIIEGLYNGELEHSVLKVIHDEGEYLYSNEGLESLCQANKYEFYEDGSIAQ